MLPPLLTPRVRRLHLWAKRAVEDWLGGAYHSVFKGVGIAFEEVREYQPGDDVRTIDWNVTARTGAPFIKRFIEERELTVMLTIDVGSSMAFGSGSLSKRQVAAEAAALVALAALHNNDRVGLLLFGDGAGKLIPPRKGTRHALRLLRELLVATDDDVTKTENQSVEMSMGDALRTLHRVLHRRALVILASDFVEGGFENAFRLTAARHDLIALFTQDAWERELPDLGVLSVAQPAMRLDTHDPSVRQEYRRRMTARGDELRAMARRADADWIDLTTNGDHLEAMHRFFKMRERRMRR